MGAVSRIDLPLALLAVGVLLICLVYTLAYVFIVPYPGFDFDGSWTVQAIESPCETNPDWCEAAAGALRVGDQLLAIGDFTYEDYLVDYHTVPFGGYEPGDLVQLTLLREGTTMQVEWPMLGPTASARFIRLIGFLILMPFWVAGTAVLLFLRPRDTVWGLLIAFNYVTAIWIATGIPSAHQVVGSTIALRCVTLLLVPVYLHLHLVVPPPILPRKRQYLLIPVYALAGVSAAVQAVNPTSSPIFNFALLVAMVGSFALLLLRLARPSAPGTRLAVRLMLVGIALAFGPGILLWLVPSMRNRVVASSLTILGLTGAISLLPFFYIYALYKHRLGSLEFRANRVLSVLSFLVLFFTTFMFVFVMGSRWVEFTTPALAFSLITSVVFVAAFSLLRRPFQRMIDRLAYGTEHNPNDIVSAFANQIPRALDREALVELLRRQITPSLLIRQSALYVFEDDQAIVFYADPAIPPKIDRLYEKLHELLKRSGEYRPPEATIQVDLDWVRLALAISVGGQHIGIWLLGKRDPDDYYPQPDIELLVTLANQIGVALVNMRLFENLERRAAELEQAYRELQELDRMKDEFVQNVSHELRTPLTIIQASGELLLEETVGELNEDQKVIIDRLTERTRGMTGLVNDILTIQQMSLEHIERQPVDMMALATSSLETAAMETAKPEYNGRVYDFDIQCCDDLPLVAGDARRLGQVLDILLNNAIKFSPEGGAITIHLNKGIYPLRDGRGGQVNCRGVEISVSDQGVGIPADQTEHIWRHFYQVDGSSTRRFGGTGLGLAIARSIVHAHCGEIWAESQEGVGSTFYVRLAAV